MKKATGAALALLTTSALVSAPAAMAQDDTSFSEDIVISSATRRPQDLQDVPIAVTVLSPETLEDNGVVNIQNLAIVAPSFAASQAQTASGTVVLRIRGVGTTSNNIGFESAVGVFIDGAYQSRPGIALGEFVDVENVEVLRGPQGTLFGRNTSAGALKIENKRPDLSEVGGFVNATYGSFEHTSLQGAVNIPVVEDKVAVRLTGATRNRRGYVRLFDRDGNKLGNSNELDQLLLRGQVGWEADSGFKGRLLVDYSESDAAVGAALEVQQSPVETAGLFPLVGLGARGGMVGPDVAVSANDDDLAQDAVDNLIAGASFVPNPSSDQLGFIAELEYPITDNADIIYIGSLRNYNATEEYDSDFSGLDVFDVVNDSPVEIDTMTHELRVQGDAMDGRLDWLVGAYYSEEEIDQQVNFRLGEDYGELVGALFFGPTAGALGANPLTVFTGVDPAGTSISQLYNQDSKSFSVFTNNTFAVTDALSLTLGLRYSDESKDGSFAQANVNNDICPATLGALGTGAVPAALSTNVFGLGCLAFLAPADLPAAAVFPLPRTFDDEFKDEELIYTAKVGYEFTPSISTYASFTHGYKSGGFNLDSTAASGGADPRFDSEEVDSYEIGLKSRLFDNRMTLNVAAFMQDFTDFQVLEFTGAQFTTFNVPKANSDGIEIETVINPVDGLTLNGGLTLLDASYPDDCAGDNPVPNTATLCGNPLTNAPETVGILGASYEGSITDKIDFFVNAQLRHESSRRTSTQAQTVPSADAIAAAGSLDAAVAAAGDVPFDIQPSNTKINARLGFTDADDLYALEFWATNLTNEVTRGVTFNTVFRSGSRSAFIQEPRMYGVTVRRNF
ncbi:TonB-dependent receptor [Litorimonas sp. WD9-15]|uniref:TonB-dependent receptor n=1 Tax=Litorimonas sp. WD9-15 TaxID=3418716 RepID=UPI003CFBD401